MLWAAVPEATIDEDGDTCTSEDDISGSAKAGQWPKVHSVTQAHGMKKAPNSQLRLGVPGAVALHRFPGGRSGCQELLHFANLCRLCILIQLQGKQRHGDRAGMKFALGLRAEVALGP